MIRFTNFDLEEVAISELIFDQKLVEDYYINPQWFQNEHYKAIVDVLVEFKGKEKTVVEITERINEKFPKIHFDITDLASIASAAITTSHFKSDLQLVKKSFYRRMLDTYVSAYQSEPTAEIEDNMRTTLQILDKLEENEDEGLIDGALDDFLYKLDNEVESGVKTYAGLDTVLGDGLRGGQLITIGARPAVGKSAFVVNLAYKAMQRNKEIVVDYFTLEMGKQEVIKRFVSLITGINSYRLINPKLTLQGDKEKESVVNAIKYIRNQNINIYDKVNDISGICKEIRRRASEAKDKPYIAFVDYIGLVRVKDMTKNRYLQIGEITRELKTLTNELDISIIQLAQLNRNLENREDKAPQLDDLRESGDIEQDSNVVAFLHKPDKKDPSKIQFIVRKNREGITSTLNFRFAGEKMKFDELFE